MKSGKGGVQGPGEAASAIWVGYLRKSQLPCQQESTLVLESIELPVLGSANFQFQARQAGRRIGAKDLVHEHILPQMIKNANT